MLRLVIITHAFLSILSLHMVIHHSIINIHINFVPIHLICGLYWILILVCEGNAIYQHFGIFITLYTKSNYYLVSECTISIFMNLICYTKVCITFYRSFWSIENLALLHTECPLTTVFKKKFARHKAAETSISLQNISANIDSSQLTVNKIHSQR